MIRKELEEYWRVEHALREKIFEYIDKLNRKIDIYLRFDNEDYEHRFVEIKNKYLVDDGGFLWDYRGFTIGEILDIWDSLEQYVKEG